MELGNELQQITEQLHGEIVKNAGGREKGAKGAHGVESPRIVRDPSTGRFQPGTRAGGRPPGAASVATRARELLMNHSEELVAIALEKVRTEGSSALLSDLLRFAMPQSRSQLQNVMIPDAAAAMAAGDFDGALGAVTQAVLNGDISPDAGKVSTDQIRNAEEAKRLRHIEDEINRLSERVVNGFAKRVA